MSESSIHGSLGDSEQEMMRQRRQMKEQDEEEKIGKVGSRIKNTKCQPGWTTNNIEKDN